MEIAWIGNLQAAAVDSFLSAMGIPLQPYQQAW